MQFPETEDKTHTKPIKDTSNLSKLENKSGYFNLTKEELKKIHEENQKICNSNNKEQKGFIAWVKEKVS